MYISILHTKCYSETDIQEQILSDLTSGHSHKILISIIDPFLFNWQTDYWTITSESETIANTCYIQLLLNVVFYSVHEAKLAGSFNLPMISHFCPHPAPSDKTMFPTFARTRPPASFVSKSAASLLLKYNWTRDEFENDF